MSTPNTEEVKALGEKAMAANEALKSTVETHGKKLEKLDAIDLDSLKKMKEDVLNGLEVAQKADQTAKGEAKAREDMAKGLETQLKEMHEAGITPLAKDVNEMKAAIERLSLSGADGTGEVKALEKKWRNGFREFTKSNNPNAMYLSDFIGGAPELKDLSVGSQPDGGFMVMPVFGPMITARIFETSPIRSIASQMDISSDAIEFPTDNDQAASGGWVGETQSRPNTGTPQITGQRIQVYEQYANPRMTQKLLDDASFDAEAWIQKKVADIMARTENAAFVMGQGVSTPHGFLTYPNYNTPGAFQAGAIEQVNTTVSGGITYASLIHLMGSLKDGYQPNARFVMQRATMSTFLSIVDGQGRPIFNMNYDRNAGAQGLIMGQPVTFASDMPAVATGSKAVAYGDFEQGYLIVDRVGIRILRDPYTSKPYVQFYTTKRVGGDVIGWEAIKILVLQ